MKTMVAGCALVMVVILAGGCGTSQQGENPVSQPTRDLSVVLAAHAPTWMAMAGVVGVAEGLDGQDKPCLRIYVIKLTPELKAQLPDHVEGYPVEIEESGKIEPMDRK